MAGGIVLLLLAALGFAFHTHFRASGALAAEASVKRELDGVKSELQSMKLQFSSRNTEMAALQLTHGHTQRRLTELTGQLQRKEAELRGVGDQHRTGREAELSKMVEELRAELVRTDGVIDALDTKVAQMERMHANREKDWHKLAGTWVTYEQDLHDQYQKCTEEVAKLQNQTFLLTKGAPLPEAEPLLTPDTDFGHIGVEIPAHAAHRFDPLPSPGGAVPGADLPLPEAKIRDSIVQMTGGKVGLDPVPATDHQAPTPVPIHHHDIYHGDFQDDTHQNDQYHGHYDHDHYQGHYDSYDPMDQYWMRDAHGDWNADEHPEAAAEGDLHGDHHPDVGHHDQHHQQHPDQHQQHHQHHQQEQHQNHHTNDHWQQQPHVAHGAAGPVENPVPPPMAGMDPQPAHAQHAPSQWHQEQQQQQADAHKQYQQAQQEYEAQQHHYQQQQQQYQQHQEQQAQQHQQQQQQQEQHQQQPPGDAHHPHGDLAYKMGW